jgi:hypothetical protein
MTQTESSEMELRVLAAMRKVLTRVIRETASPPGTRHPLSQACLEDLRQCLFLIDSRQRDLSPDTEDARPRYKGEHSTTDSVEIPLAELLKRKDN